MSDLWSIKKSGGTPDIKTMHLPPIREEEQKMTTDFPPGNSQGHVPSYICFYQHNHCHCHCAYVYMDKKS